VPTRRERNLSQRARDGNIAATLAPELIGLSANPTRSASHPTLGRRDAVTLNRGLE